MFDNQSAIELTKNLVAYERSKHFEVKFHYHRDQVYTRKIELIHCRTEVQPNNALTKSMKIERFLELRKMLRVVFVLLFIVK